MGEAIANYLNAVGIRTRVRTMERAALLTAWREKKLKGLFVGATGSAGNASTRLESLATARGVLSYGSIPEVDTSSPPSFRKWTGRSVRRRSSRSRRSWHERMMFAPIWENGFIAPSGRG
jgi:hypothetical protein